MLKGFFEQLKAAAMEAGFESVEIFYQGGRAFSTKIFRTEIERYQVSEDAGISIRGVYDGKVGYFYSERIAPELIGTALEAMKNNALLVESNGETIARTRQIPVAEKAHLPLPDHEEVVETLRGMERQLLAMRDEIVDVPHNLYAEHEAETVIMNSHGLALSQKTCLNYLVFGVLAKRDVRSKTAVRVATARGGLEIPDALAGELTKEAVELLDAQPVVSGVYDVVLRHDVAADLLDAFAGIFSGEALEKGLTPLKGRMGERIGAERLTIIDDPMVDSAPIHRTFDDEGIETTAKRVVNQGRLQQFLHNTRTASVLGMARTGNGYRSSIKSVLGISPTNLFIEPGTLSLEDLMTDVGEGLLIIDVQALHSGLNPVSGDFSLPVQGYRIKGGRPSGTVDQITMSGNVIDLFGSLIGVADDLHFNVPNGMGSVGSPSLSVKGLSISGK